jgi:NAD(P)H-dependent FMN reductase
LTSSCVSLSHGEPGPPGISAATRSRRSSSDVVTLPNTKEWAAKVAEFDGYVFVTPEYNHSTSGVLKNALDYVYNEWNNKAAGIVSYGGVGGARAAEHLRLILAELQVATVRQQVALSLMTEFENYSVFKPGEHLTPALDTLLDQTVAWAGAFEPLHA